MTQFGANAFGQGGLSAGAVTNIIINSVKLKSFWVDGTYGDPATAIADSLVLKYKTISAAKLAAVAAGGGNVVVLPGNYTDSDLLRNGVDYFYFMEAIVTHGSNLYNHTVAGPMVCNILGYGTFIGTGGFTFNIQQDATINFEYNKISGNNQNINVKAGNVTINGGDCSHTSNTNGNIVFGGTANVVANIGYITNTATAAGSWLLAFENWAGELNITVRGFPSWSGTYPAITGATFAQSGGNAYVTVLEKVIDNRIFVNAAGVSFNSTICILSGNLTVKANVHTLSRWCAMVCDVNVGKLKLIGTFEADEFPAVNVAASAIEVDTTEATIITSNTLTPSYAIVLGNNEDGFEDKTIYGFQTSGNKLKAGGTIINKSVAGKGIGKGGTNPTDTILILEVCKIIANVNAIDAANPQDVNIIHSVASNATNGINITLKGNTTEFFNNADIIN